MINKAKLILDNKKARFLFIIGVIVIIGSIVWRGSRKNSGYIIEKAQYDSIVEIVSETGKVTTAGSTPIYSTTKGMVDAVFVQNGDVVAVNEPLFSVKSTATKQEKDAALSTYLASKTALDGAKATQLSLQAAMFGKWDTFKELAQSDDYEDSEGNPKYINRSVPEFHIPEKEWLAAEAQYKNQQQVINQKSVETSAAWQAYLATQDSTVSAVLAGEVRNVGVSRGDLVTVPTTTPSTSVPPVLLLVDNTVDTIIKLDITENDILKINEGQNASVMFDALSEQGKSYSGHVIRVDSIASTADVVNFSVYIALDDALHTLRRGMTADVDIIVSKKDNVLTVPSSAVKPYQGGRAVRVIGKAGELEFVPVKVGARGDGKVEILSGIKVGTEVVVALANEKIKRSGGFF